MKEKYIKLLDKQGAKLSLDDFDLDAWKISTTHLFTIIFGGKDPKIREINDLRIDNSSWTLRDSGPRNNPIESCKRKGKEILDIAKDEIELLGINNPQTSLDNKLKEVLTESQYTNLISQTNTAKERSETLKSLSKDKLIELLMSIIQ